MEHNVILVILVWLFEIVGFITTVKWIIKKIRSIITKIQIGITNFYFKDKPGKIVKFPTESEQTKYYESTYFQATRKTYQEVLNDTGRYGEYLIYDYLKDFQNSGGKFLFNCYLNKENDQTTEIDVMLIHYNGIFVFESKNYSGWIFGNEESEFWMQTLPIKRGVSHKEQFFNPIIQNNVHIKALKRIVGNNIPIYSIIVFSERCTLKDITITSPDILVIQRNEIFSTVNEILFKNNHSLDANQIEDIYQKLYPYTQVSEEIKQQHIDNIQQNIQRGNEQN